MSLELTSEQLGAISVIERACSVLSLAGCLLTIATFCASKSFHKPVNRLVFYASFGNMLTNLGTLMSQAYVNSPNSPQCQFQGFLIQMFMPADAFWTLAMAVNVYLTFYYKFDAVGLRRMEIPYIICCYGVPLVPALTYLWIINEKGHRVYGNATLWCWISDDWEVWRIATFYGPVWLSIVITFFIYIRAGRTIYEKRLELYYLCSSDAEAFGTGRGLSKITEVSITTEVVQEPFSSVQMHSIGRPQSAVPPGSEQYSVTISANPGQSDRGFLGQDPWPRADECSRGRRNMRRRRMANNRRRVYERKNAAWSYTKCSILFFTAILITWIPSSANRVFSVIHRNRHSAPLEFMSAFVLPLQGFWNAVIYFVTSWGASKSLWMDLRQGRRPDIKDFIVGKSLPNVGGEEPECPRIHHKRQSSVQKLNYGASESTRELADTGTSEDERLSSRASATVGGAMQAFA